MATLGFIGMGNMGYAMLKGALTTMDKSEIVFSSHGKERVNDVYEETGVRFLESNADVANHVKYLVLTVKPQYYPQVCDDIKDIITRDTVIITVAPGISISDMENQLNFHKKIARSMPNTPALIGKGMTGVCFGDGVLTEEEITFVTKLFTSFGEMEVVPEKLIDSVVAASGSSPAFVFMFIEAMADAAVRTGMSRKQAYHFVAQTVAGSAELMLATGKHPAELKDMVTSPAGTTIEGVAALETMGFRGAVMEATEAVYEKCQDMGKKKNDKGI